MISKNNVAKWCKALRSGKYPQDVGFLQTEKGFCCLGVACDLFIPKSKLIVDIDGRVAGVGFLQQNNTPALLNRLNYDFVNKTGNALATLNDGGYSFDEIADMLELVYIHEAL